MAPASGSDGRSAPESGLWRRRQVYVMTWPAFARCVEQMGQALHGVVAPATVVIGIARGGLVPATYFANVLGLEAFGAMGVARNLTNDRYSAKQEPRLLWTSFGPADLRDRDVLLVDDVVGEGRTMAYGRRVLLGAGAASVRTAAVARIATSTFQPDYCGIAVDDWIVFPWEVTPPPGAAVVTL